MPRLNRALAGALTSTILGLGLSAVAGAAFAEDPICAQYRAALDRAGKSLTAIDQVLGHIPSACSALKATAVAHRASVAAELARASQPPTSQAPTAPHGPSTTSAERARERTEKAQTRLASERAADDAAFAIAKAANNYEAYNAYLAQYPDGAHADEARQIEADGRRAQQQPDVDDAAFQSAKTANTYDAYNSYLSNYPNGKHADAARTARASLTTDEPYRVHVCNKTTKNVVFAAVYQPVGDDKEWKHQGWWKTAPGDCVYIFDAGNPSFSIRAESLDDSTYWGTSFQQCFQTDGPYQFMVPIGITTCPSPSTSRPAYSLTATARGEYTWSIDSQQGTSGQDTGGAAVAADEPYRVHVCNKTTKNVVFAAVYQPVGDDKEWKHQGWWKTAPGDCVYIFDTGNPSFSIRAESLDDSTYWGTANFNQCFQTDGPYQFMVAVGITDCPSPSTSRPAYSLTATARGEYTWSIGN